MSERTSRRGISKAPRGGLHDTRIDDLVVLKLAGIAAREVEGIEMRRDPALPGLRNVFSGGGTGGEDLTLGVRAEVGEAEAAVEITVAVEFGRPIPRVADVARRNVARKVEGLAGLRIARVDVTVVDVVTNGDGGTR